MCGNSYGGVPIIRLIVYWGLYSASFVHGNYHVLSIHILASAQGILVAFDGAKKARALALCRTREETW